LARTNRHPAFGYRGQRLFVKTESADQSGEEKREIRLEAANQFAAEMDHRSRCIREDTAPRTPSEMGNAAMRIVEAIHESGRSGRPVRIA